MATIEKLFQELDDSRNDHQKALEICDKILKQQPNDKEAFHCKVVCLIHLEKFEDAISLLTASSTANNFVFEHAYCYYRVRRYKDALSLLKSVPDPKPVRVLQLLAQTYYRLEDFNSSIAAYEELIQKQKVNSSEVKTNLLAAYCSNENVDDGLKLVNQNQAILKESFEFGYNASCASIIAKDFVIATDYLNSAIATCKSYAEEEGMTVDEIDDELAIVRVQLGYVQQMLDKHDEAMALYNQVLNIKPSDAAVTAVASNNIVTLKKDHSLFDSEKKLKNAMSETLEQKLAEWQKRAIAFNRCLLLFKMKKPDQCRELALSLQEKYPDSSMPTLILASLLFREKKFEEGENLLKKYIQQYPDRSVPVQSSLAQIFLSRDQVNEAISTLESIQSLKHTPVMVATLTNLYEQQGNINAAVEVFDASVNYWKAKLKDDKSKNVEENFIKLANENALFKLKHKRPREAATVYEALYNLDSRNANALAGLVIAYSQFDAKEAEKFARHLPKPPQLEKVDIEALENTSRFKSQPKANQDAKTLPQKTNEPAVGKLKEKKKKKKKKKKPCKKFDPNVTPDPERWLPKRERSYYKKRKKAPLSRGAQGAILSSSGSSSSLSTSTTTTSKTAETKPEAPKATTTKGKAPPSTKAPPGKAKAAPEAAKATAAKTKTAPEAPKPTAPKAKTAPEAPKATAKTKAPPAEPKPMPKKASAKRRR